MAHHQEHNHDHDNNDVLNAEDSYDLDYNRKRASGPEDQLIGDLVVDMQYNEVRLGLFDPTNEEDDDDELLFGKLQSSSTKRQKLSEQADRITFHILEEKAKDSEHTNCYVIKVDQNKNIENMA